MPLIFNDADPDPSLLIPTGHDLHDPFDRLNLLDGLKQIPS
jgi:hypothetical protein